MTLPIFAYPDGRQFIAQERVERPSRVLGRDLNEDELKNFVMDRWTMAFEGKRAETARLKRNSLYYDGFHYTTPWQQRENLIANYCFATVETVVPIVTEQKPRPEIVPRTSMGSKRANALQEFATWYQDRAEFDRATIMGTRDKCIYGWNANLISFDYRSGFPFPKPLSVFDYYPDPTARNEDEAEYFFLAIAISTELLKSWYPECEDLILPDNIASPSYDAVIRPFQMFMEDASRYDGPTMLDAIDYVKREGEATPAGGTMLTTPGSETREHGRTTMVFQMFVRDDSLKEVVYLGTEVRPDPQNDVPLSTPGMDYRSTERNCPTGWWQINMTSHGKILRPKGGEMASHVDACYGGLPWVIGRMHQRTDRMWSPGILDHIIPVQRGINRRNVLLDRALELSANPPIITDTNSGLRADQSTVEGGEILTITRGSDVKWLEYRGPSQQQFEMLQLRSRDIDTISGVHDVQQGQRPAGIEAAAAIRRLQEAAAIRIRGMEVASQFERAQLLKKCLTCAAMKLQRRIVFKASNGKDMSVEPADLLDEYDIRFAAGTGTVAGREQLKELAVQLFQLQAIDDVALLEELDWKGREEVLGRMQMQRQREMQAMAEASAKEQKNGKAPAGRFN